MQNNAVYDLNNSEMVFPPNVTNTRSRVILVDDPTRLGRHPRAAANRRKTKAQRAARRKNR